MNRARQIRAMIVAGALTIILFKGISVVLRSNYKDDLARLNASQRVEYIIDTDLVDNVIDLDDYKER